MRRHQEPQEIARPAAPARRRRCQTHRVTRQKATLGVWSAHGGGPLHTMTAPPTIPGMRRLLYVNSAFTPACPASVGVGSMKSTPPRRTLRLAEAPPDASIARTLMGSGDTGCSGQRRGAGPSAGIQVRRSSTSDFPRAALDRLSHWPLGSGEGRLQVGSYLGHNLFGTTDLRLPAAFTAGTTLAGLGSARGPDGNPVPGHLLVHGDAHGHLPSVGESQTYPLGKPATKFLTPGPPMRCVAIALVCQGRAGAAGSDRQCAATYGRPQGCQRRKVGSRLRTMEVHGAWWLC
jgi:hypothetical protein